MKYGSSEWYLYHSYKNEEALPWVIILTAFSSICRDGLAAIIFIWIVYLLYCRYNNAKLDRDPEIIKSRIIVNQINERYKKNK